MYDSRIPIVEVALAEVRSVLGWPREKEKEKQKTEIKMGFADKVGEGTPPGSYSNFAVGHYPMVQLVEYNTKDTQDRGEAFVATFDVLKSNVEAMPAGTLGVDWYQGTDQFPKTAPGAVREMFAEVAGEPIEEIDVKNVQIIMGSAKPLRGRLVSATAKTHITRINKREIIVVDFKALDMDDETMTATAKRLRAGLQLDETPF